MHEEHRQQSQPYLNVIYERDAPIMATPMVMTYGITRRVELPPDLAVHPVQEQQQVIREIIQLRRLHHDHPTPFGQVVGYTFHGPGGTQNFDAAGAPTTPGRHPQ